MALGVNNMSVTVRILISVGVSFLTMWPVFFGSMVDDLKEKGLL
jgi:hypothetical protein